MATKDPHRYFRIEARELLAQLSEGMLALENGGDAQPVVARLLRLAHTLKGAASVVRQPQIAAQAHAIEDILAPLREMQGEAPGEAPAIATRAQIDGLLQLNDEIARGVAALDPAPATHPTTAAAPEFAAAAEIPQLAPEELDALLASVDQTHAHLAALKKGVALSQQAGASLALGDSTQAARQLASLEQLLDATLHQLGRELLSVRDGAEQLRLLPAAQLFMPLQRAARDAAQSQGKSVNFQASGGEVRVEAAVLNAVQGALMQMIRNAVAHGIELPAQRLAAGKPAPGCISLRIERRGRQLLFACSDDGAGVDIESLRAAAQAKARPTRPMGGTNRRCCS